MANSNSPGSGRGAGGEQWATRDDVWVWSNEGPGPGKWGPLSVGFGVGGAPSACASPAGSGFTSTTMSGSMPVDWIDRPAGV